MSISPPTFPLFMNRHRRSCIDTLSGAVVAVTHFFHICVSGPGNDGKREGQGGTILLVSLDLKNMLIRRVHTLWLSGGIDF